MSFAAGRAHVKVRATNAPLAFIFSTQITSFIKNLCAIMIKNLFAREARRETKC
jgi:hypothetical protein